MRYFLIAALVLPLQGCWFFLFPIPSSLFQAGNSCAVEDVKVGTRFRNWDTGQVGTVEKVIGRSSRCQDGKIPVLVDVRYDEAK